MSGTEEFVLGLVQALAWPVTTFIVTYILAREWRRHPSHRRPDLDN